MTVMPIGLAATVSAQDPESRLRAMTRAQAHRRPRTVRVDSSERCGASEAILDGLITNAADLRRTHDLTNAPTDADVALALYERGGVRALGQLRGEFSLIVADHRRSELVAARDPLGVRPLHYARTPDGFLVASEQWPVALAATPSPEPNLDALARWLTSTYAGVHETLFRGVFSVPPGSAVALTSDGRERVHRLWQPDVRRTHEPASLEACIDEFESLLGAAISARSRGRTTSVAVSGGLDSTAIARLAPGDVQLFTMTFPGLDCDESRWTVPFARGLHAPLHTVDVLSSSVSRDPPGRTGDRPELYFPNVEFLRPLAQAARANGVEALFFGFGADQLMMRRPVAAIADHLRKARLRGALDIARRAGSTLRHRLGLVRSAIMWSDAPELTRPTWLTPSAFARARSTADRELVDGPWESLGPAGEPWRVVVGHGTHEWVALAEHLLATEGLELRAPFLDVAVVEYLLALPHQYRIGPWRGPSKPLLRERAGPDLRSRRLRTHFGAYAERQLRFMHHRDLLERFRASRLAEVGLVDSPAIISALTSGRELDPSLLLAIAAELWLQSLWR